MAGKRVHASLLNTTLLVVGLGYFIDCFDLFLYNAMRVPSLRELGLDGDALTKTGILILNLQVVGMLIGSLIWGIAGDRAGRKKALIGSVLIYSIGSLGCAFVHQVAVYAVLRFLTGVGLAGELGLGAVLVAETVPDGKREWGLVIYTVFAYCGVISASLLAGWLPWRTCYAAGGLMGLVLLLGRMALFESGLYEAVARGKAARGSLRLLLRKKDLLKRWLCCIFFAVPYYFLVNILITLAPEFGKAAGAAEPIKANIALMVYSLGSIGGAILCALVGHVWRHRTRTLLFYMLVNAAFVVLYLTQSGPTAPQFYALCGAMGLGNYYVLLMFAAVEQFGTNMRATAGTSALSIGRATLVLTNSLFLAFRAGGYDVLQSGACVGLIALLIGLCCLPGLRNTYRGDMDFIEESP